MSSLDKTVRCWICGRFYDFMGMYVGDQSCCPKCRQEKEKAKQSTDTPDQVRRRQRYFWS